MDLQKGDILLYKKGNSKGIWKLIDYLISWYSKSEYVHCGIIVDVNTSHLTIGEHLSQGFTIWDNYNLFHALKRGDIDVYRANLSDDERIKLIETVKCFEGHKYDYKEIFDKLLNFFKLPQFFQGNGIYTCASIIAMCYRINLIILVDKFNDDIIPADLSKSKLLNKVIYSDK